MRQSVRDAEAGTLADPWVDPPEVFDRLRAQKATASANADAAPESIAESI